MDKNLFLAVTASILVYAVWFGYVEKKLTPPSPAPVAVSSAAAPGMVSASPQPAAEAEPAAAPAASSPAAGAGSVIPAARDSAETYRLGRFQVTIRSHGAAITAWKTPVIDNLVLDPDPGLLSTFPELAFKHVGKPDELTFQATLPNGLRVLKQFVPGDESAKPPVLPRVRLTLQNPTGKELDSPAWTMSVGPGLNTIPSELKTNPMFSRTLGLQKGGHGLHGKVAVFMLPGEGSWLHRAFGGKPKLPSEDPADYQWIGIDNHFFVAAMLPQDAQFAKIAPLPDHQLVLTATSYAIPAKGSKTWDVPFYAGAKGQTWLASYKLGLERAIDFGFFSGLGRIVLRVLYRLDEATHNWGWAIILLTVCIQVIMFPATYQSLRATAKMKLVQPEIAKLQQKYSKDPQRLNQEMMALYKKHGANPLGGCLPMVVQLPIFYALFTALRNAWELHNAPWIGWVRDLSVHDPYYVLPLIMGGIMFAQNKMNPAASADPTQQQMMTFMPIIFTVMFLRFPAGLVLYYLTNSLVTLIIQLALRKRLGLAGTPVKAKA